VIDALVDKVIAGEPAALIAACKALDRVFRAGRYWIPQYNKASQLDRLLGRVWAAAEKPRYTPRVPETWWYDSAKRLRRNVTSDLSCNRVGGRELINK